MNAPLNVVLLEPEIPQNTGNVARTCAATGTRLHLVKPIGFSLEDRYLRRAGLDYWEYLDLCLHDSWQAFLETSGVHWGSGASSAQRPPLYLFTRKADTVYTDVPYPEGTWLVFGRESTGLPEELINGHRESCIRIPVRDHIRSLNLSNSVAVIVYEALRTHGFSGLSLKA